MLENAMPGEVRLANGVPAEHHLKQQAASQNALPNETLQEMAEKLEKSETGRKKLRQAISMLKEKVEANEKVLQVNEILRQECGKERLRAEAERNRAEEEKTLREQVEKEGLSTKEQLVRVLQRLDAVERNCKADHSEVERMQKEMKQAISGLGGAVKAIEAAHSSFECLEKNLLGKVSNAVCASTKSISVAEAAISDAKGAQRTAAAAEKLSESLVSRVTVLQKQGTSLDQRVTILQQEIRTRQLEPFDNEPKSNGNRASNGISLAGDKPSGRGMVLSKNQQQECTRLTSPRAANKDCSTEGAALSPIQARAEGVRSVVNTTKPTDRHSLIICKTPSPKTRHGAKGAGINGMELLPDGQAKNIGLRDVSGAPVGGKAILDKNIADSSKGNIVREALDAAKEKRKLQRTGSSSKVVSQPGKSPSCPRTTLGTLTNNATHASKVNPVDGEELKGRLLLDSGSSAVPGLLENEKNDGFRLSAPAPCLTESNHGRNAEDFPGWRPHIKNKFPGALDGNVVENRLASAYSSLSAKEKIHETPKSGTKIVKHGHHKEKLSIALLKDISKLFLKEKKSHAKVEQKLAVLQSVLQNSEEAAVAEGGLDGTLQKGRKRKRRESLMENSKKRACVEGAQQTPKVNDHSFLRKGHCVGEDVAHRVVKVGASKLKSSNVASPLLPPVNKSGHSDPRGCGNDVCEVGGQCVENLKDSDGHQFPDVGPPSLVLDNLAAVPIVNESCQGMDICTENVDGVELNGGWDSDSESSEDELGEDWWTKERILLSPSLPEVPPPILPLEEPDSNALLPWPSATDMTIEDLSIFLDVLPPIDQEVRNEDRAVATLPYLVGSKAGTEELDVQSSVAALDVEHSKEGQGEVATDTFSSLHKCRERSPSNNLAECFESGYKCPDEPGGFVEEEKKESLIAGSSICGSSLTYDSPPEPSFFPQVVSVVALGKYEGGNGILTVDSGARVDDVLQDSQGAVKEEKVDAVHCAAIENVENLSPYSVELVMGGSAPERGVNSTESTVRQGSLGSMTDMSDKIMEAFGRTRNVLVGALNHSVCDAFGSSLAVAPELASFFVSSTLSKSDLMCILTASLVDSYALWDNEKTSSCSGSNCMPLQLLIDIVKQVLATEWLQNILSPDQAFFLFAVQLQRFLIQGTIQPVCAIEHCFDFTTPSSKQKRLQALISGGKLLAAFCKTIGNLDLLRNSSYRVLRFSDMDSECLLAIISSFASAGYKSLFSADKDDVVGQAVQVVISELIHDAEVGSQGEASSAKREEIKCQMEMRQGSFRGVGESVDCTELLQNLRALREVIGEEDGLSFEGFVPRLVESFHGMITASPGSDLTDNRHLFLRSLRMVTCNQIKPKSLSDANVLVKSKQGVETCQPATDLMCIGINGSALQIGEKDDDSSPIEDYCWRDVKIKSSIQHPVSQSESDATLMEKWELKFYNVTNALELVASHLGWEWTYNDFIVEHLWKLVSPGAPATTVACVAYMFGLLGRLGREVDSTELPGVDELRKSLLVILNSDQASPTLSEGRNFSFRAQVAAAQALLVLSNFNRKDEVVTSQDPERLFSKSSELHSKSVKSLWNWVQSSKAEIQEILPLSLRCALLSIDKNNFVPIF